MKQMRSLLVAVTLWLSPLARAGLIVTPNLHADSHAMFVYKGTTYQASQGFDGVSSVSAQALAGLFTTPEARTAARVSGDEIAVNARMDDKFLFSLVDFNDNSSTAQYQATIEKVSGSAEHIFASFLLPLSYVETSTNEELTLQHVNPVITASIASRLCLDAQCNGTDVTQFFFQAFFDNTYKAVGQNFIATGQAGLDVSALRHPTITDTTVRDATHGLRIRTLHMEFGPFLGVVDLGELSVGQSLEFNYTMQAGVFGTGASNVGIASINDPFFFSTDPVTQGAPVLFETAPADASAPEPGSLVLAGLGLMVTLGAQARRTSRRLRGRRRGW